MDYPPELLLMVHQQRLEELRAEAAVRALARLRSPSVLRMLRAWLRLLRTRKPGRGGRPLTESRPADVPPLP